MAMAENFVTPRDADETATLLGQRYGVAPTPGCQLQPPDIHGWTPKVEEPTPPKPVPSVVTGKIHPPLTASDRVRQIVVESWQGVRALRCRDGSNCLVNQERSECHLATIATNISLS